MSRAWKSRPTPGEGWSGPDSYDDSHSIAEKPTVRQRARAFAALLHDELIDLARDDAGAVPLVALARAVHDALGGAA